jgi:predicted acetyltransferase
MRCFGDEPGMNMEHDDAVTLQLITREREAVLVNLLELYLHDMSETFPIRISETGRFGYAWLPTYWAEPDRRLAYLISSRGELAGFVLVTHGAPSGFDVETDWDVAEFFVLRAQRRHGVGQAAIRRLWDERPGRWLVRVSEGNLPGLAFWPKVVRAYAGDAFSEQRVPGRHYPWRVFQLTTGGKSEQ